MALLRAILAGRRPAVRLPVTGARPLAVFHVETGGCEGCAMEVAALDGAAYGLPATGIAFVATPRLAEVLLVTGPLTRAMAPVLEAAWHAMPEPRALVAVGACAIDGGPFPENYAVLGGLEGRATLDMTVPGCPPSPAAILAGLARVLERDVAGQAGVAESGLSSSV
ncbi:NADH ubiquinone oxidoreductase 20 kDa subunit [Gluconacetobacter diazotrophicus PA1 5]|uniref:NADH-quinone oxidoreductase subunit B family protein n=1 Tax=Gluconacetobacter diazotrophicus TaxID=33996 RepID=UPI000173B381|nr:NADH-quinone oxidoreductase subunit B [Gluconacetobacter diazotrophicus]ACI52790.1 NADH ubiquinone oxidoreductase 20 kDa subunit [Gluconacetobacter diazotrophicus PA1 5]TWB09065.1 [NiFe]-hydrogenase III apoprotein small subunit [Gluconacetobacter diazotrophicus]